MALFRTPTVTRKSLGTGDGAVMDTLTAMCAAVARDQASPIVVYTARQLAMNVNARSEHDAALAIRQWLGKRWVFIPDPLDDELIIDGETSLNNMVNGQMSGDCDDVAVLGASLGKAIGIAPAFTVLAFDEEGGATVPRYSHVFASLLPIDGAPVTLDVTRPAGPVAPVARVLSVDA
jgi:hypothetical protein